MTRNPPRSVQIIDSLLILCSGLGVGVLMGLSVSPVVHIIVASVISVVVGIVSALAGFEIVPSETPIKPRPEFRLTKRYRVPRISPLPMTMLIVGLVIGASGGIYMRTNEFFGVSPHRMVARWRDTGIEEKEIKRRMFDQLYPAATPSPAETQESNNSQARNIVARDPPIEIANKPQSVKTNPKLNLSQVELPTTSASGDPKVAGLFSLSAKDCQLLALKHGDELRARLVALNEKRVSASLQRCSSLECLETIKELLCSR